MDVKTSTALLAIARVYKVDYDASDGHNWFLYFFNTESIIIISESTAMSRRLDVSEVPVSSGDVRPVYVDMFDNRGVILWLTNANQERFYRKREDYFDFHRSMRKISFWTQLVQVELLVTSLSRS